MSCLHWSLTFMMVVWTLRLHVWWRVYCAVLLVQLTQCYWFVCAVPAAHYSHLYFPDMQTVFIFLFWVFGCWKKLWVNILLLDMSVFISLLCFDMLVLLFSLCDGVNMFWKDNGKFRKWLWFNISDYIQVLMLRCDCDIGLSVTVNSHTIALVWQLYGNS